MAGRDALIFRLLPDPDAVAALIAACQVSRDNDPHAADLCAALAVLAYRRGDGALSNEAIDRALRLDPDHRLAQLMLGIAASGMPPAELDNIAAAR